MEEVPVLRIRVCGDESEIAVLKPSIFGGHTTDGYVILNLLVVAETLSRLAIAMVNTVAIPKVAFLPSFMKAPGQKSDFSVYRREAPR
jgi:hypothetical protein